MRKPILTSLWLALLSVGLGIVSAQAPSVSDAPKGSIGPRHIVAADFTLTDQKGEPFKMSGTRGEIVVLSFIYTHCADICPFTTMKIKATKKLLGDDAGKVVFVAITTDPLRDTPEVMADYSESAGLYDTWHFLTGPLDDLRRIWNEYGVGVHKVSESDVQDSEARGMPEMGTDRAKGLDETEIAAAHALIEKFAGGYAVTHSGPFWIIDAEGETRAILDADASPSDIVADIEAFM
jgi:cytochrome oxidase Cu insertion factor (SCO1/SenC/PrrC family)